MVQFARSRPQQPASKKRIDPKAEKSIRLPSTELRLVLKCLEPECIITIPISEESLIVGRMIGDFSPDVDLNAAGGAIHGVSRRHASLTLRDGELYLEDLKSTNGTLINGFQLTPEHTYLLRSGDEIELGMLRMTVTVVRVPPR